MAPLPPEVRILRLADDRQQFPRHDMVVTFGSVTHASNHRLCDSFIKMPS